jgi:glutamate-ammonia-ligase adenylyltransferase
MDADAAGLARSALADAALAALLGRVVDDFAERFGRVRGGGMAVVLLGKGGGREMMAGSDLDLMLVYSHPARVQESTGARRLPASQWFIRAVHAFIAAVTAPDAEGPMFAVDMRLRPSGNKGPVAVSLAAFEQYHAADAWTWERMALTRARVVAGPPRLRAAVEAAIRAALANSGEPARIRADAAAMRARLLRELPPAGPWDVKLRPGGQVEVEFVAQALQLVHARTHPGVACTTTRIALARLEEIGALPGADAALLIRADRIWRTVQGMLRITYGRAPAERLSEAPAAALTRALTGVGVDATARGGADAVDLPGLQATLDAVASEVRALFIRHVGEIEP